MTYDDMIRLYREWRSLPGMFFDQAHRLGMRPLLYAKRDGFYHSMSWLDAAAQVRSLARALRALGIDRGERVIVLSENRPEFPIAELAIMAAGGIVVPAYATNTVQDHLYVLENSGARAAIVSSRALTERLLPAAQASSGCRAIIAMEPWPRNQTGEVKMLSWGHLLAEGEHSHLGVEAWTAALQRSDTACIIYTSGTGGAPKGVMLTHGAILTNCMGAYDLLYELGLDDEVFLSFLPLSHAYEHTAGQFFPLSIGARIFYAESVEALARNLVEVQPTIMTAVPRLYESFRRRILTAMERESAFTQYLFAKTVELGSRAYEGKKPLSLTERALNLLLEFLVRRKVRSRFGGRLKAFVSGGAPLPYEIGLFFIALGVRLLQGYGQTEAAPVISCNRPTPNRISTVGPPVLDVEAKIAPDGEILVRGEMVMQGYWRDAASTAAVLKEGWLHTGDVGFIGEDRTITITDRKKDIIVNSGGDNISPMKVEGRLALEPEIAQAVVFGDRRPYLVALIVPDPEFTDAWAKRHECKNDLTSLAMNADFQKALGVAIERANATLSQIEHVRRFTVADAGFTVENGLMTPTLKVRRHKIREMYGMRLEALYAGP
ncbi:MAG: long-chain fatty acid--CoA ligase [Alphaproteobacteria bacterium]